MSDLVDTPAGQDAAAAVPDCRPMRADARRNRERILEAARESFAARGDATQMDDVAGRACVGVGTVYRHFPTKDALMGELIGQRFREFADATRASLDRPDPGQALFDLMWRNAETMAGDIAIQHAMVRTAGVWAAAEPARQELIAITDELVARAREEGTIRPDFTSLDVGAIMCGVCSVMSAPAPGLDWRRLLMIALDGVRVP
jgi:AcrR family transcriptional regulator